MAFGSLSDRSIRLLPLLLQRLLRHPPHPLRPPILGMQLRRYGHHRFHHRQCRCGLMGLQHPTHGPPRRRPARPKARPTRTRTKGIHQHPTLSDIRVDVVGRRRIRAAQHHILEGCQLSPFYGYPVQPVRSNHRAFEKLLARWM